MRPSLVTTIGLRSQNKAVQLANKYGFKPQTEDQLFIALNQIIVNKRDAGLRELAMIHPDRDLILSTANSSACGCSSNCDGDNACAKCNKHSNAYGADGTADPATTNAPTGAAPSFFHQNQTLILGVSALIVLAYILKK